MLRRFPLLAVGLLVAAGLAVTSGPASAKGMMVVQQSDGSTKTYRDVLVRIERGELALTSSDGQSVLVVGKAACSREGGLVKCLPFDATLYQNGSKYRVALSSGTVWLNPTTTTQPLSFTSAHLQPHGVMMSVTTKRGTYVSLTGTVDEVER